MYATNLHVLRAAETYIRQKMASSENDARIHMLPLVFVHSDPNIN